MSVIIVLDLSNSKLIEIPMEIGDLVNLWYLNFSHRDKKLPINLKFGKFEVFDIRYDGFSFGNLKIYQILCICSYSIFFLQKYLKEIVHGYWMS